MKQWLYNIWMYLVENKDNIFTFVLSGQVLGTVAGIFAVFRQFKNVSNNNAISTKLNETLGTTNTMATSINSTSELTKMIYDENKLLKATIVDMQTKNEESALIFTDKLNTMLEVQSIVYSTIKDDAMRKTVNNMLNTARYSEINIKDKLQIQIDELKAKVSDKMLEVNNAVDLGITNVKKVVNIVDEIKNNTVTRY